MKLPEDYLKEAADIMKGKREDYSSLRAVHQNFERCELVTGWFFFDIDKVYVTLIIVKLVRLAVLLSGQKKPNNESIEDSFKDLINYCALWASKRCDDARKETTEN